MIPVHTCSLKKFSAASLPAVTGIIKVTAVHFPGYFPMPQADSCFARFVAA
jgi:hypothetical protein